MKYLILITLLSINIFAKSPCTHTQTEFQCVKYIKNHDGDTVTFNISDVHPLIGNKISVRISGIDTPEMKTKNPCRVKDINKLSAEALKIHNECLSKMKCEKNKAVAAKKVVETILSKAKRIDIKNISRGKYFRIVGDVVADGVNIKTVLLKKELAYEYNGKAKAKVNWCEIRKPAEE